MTTPNSRNGDLAPSAAQSGQGTGPFAAGALILDGRFRVEGLVGKGGMGSVYVAEQVSLGRKVAVKVLRQELAEDAESRERLRREALILSAVDHPGVVRVIDFGQAEGWDCIVMELVTGESLKAVIAREAPLSVDRVKSILGQLARGLGAIHGHGIVHRDLKPENVLLTLSEEGGEQVRLLDFGVARLAPVGGTAGLTADGLIVGTPAYIAPEQALGEPTDERTDLYALGCIAYELLTGSRPFPGPGPEQFIDQHINEPPPPLLEIAPRLSAHPSLVAVVMACLQKAPALRPSSTTEFLDRLQRSVRTTSRPAFVAPLTPAKVGRGRSLWAAAAGGALGLALLVGWHLVPWKRVLGERAEVSPPLAGSGPASALPLLASPAPSQPSTAASNPPSANPSEGSPSPVALKPTRDTDAEVEAILALHMQGRHGDEWLAVGGLPTELLPDVRVLSALVADYGFSERALIVRVLRRFPQRALLAKLQQFVAESGPAVRWGALRLVDAYWDGEGLQLTDEYLKSLKSRDCGARARSAARLAELKSPVALAPLRALKAEPVRGRGDCGQAAAAEALKALERPR